MYIFTLALAILLPLQPVDVGGLFLNYVARGSNLLFVSLCLVNHSPLKAAALDQ